MFKKKITIVIPVKDDEYYDNFVKILNFNLDYILKKIFELDLQNVFKILLIDYGSKKPISNYIYINPKFKKNIKSLYLNHKIFFKINQDKKERMNVSIAHNLGLINTKTEYCFLSHADQLYSKTFFLNLNAFINNKFINNEKTNNAILYIPRKFLDQKIFSTFPNEEAIDHYFENLNFVVQKWKNDQYYYGGGHSGWFGRTENFKKCNGMKEDLIISEKIGIIASDAESFARFSQKYQFYDSSNFGIFSFRFPYNFSPNRNKYLLKRLDPLFVDNPFKKKKWGLRKYNLSNTNFVYKKFKTENLSFYQDLKNDNLISFFKNLRIFVKSEYISKKFSANINDIFLRKIIIELIKRTKTTTYLEYGFSEHSYLSLIGSYFKGINLLGSDTKIDLEKNKIHERYYKILQFFNTSVLTYRYGMTKLISYYNKNFTHKILDYIPKQKNSTIVLIADQDTNFKNLIKGLNKNKEFISIIITKNNKKFTILKNNYKIISNNYNYTFYVSKKILEKNLEKLITIQGKKLYSAILYYIITIIFRFFFNKNTKMIKSEIY